MVRGGVVTVKEESTGSVPFRTSRGNLFGSILRGGGYEAAGGGYGVVECLLSGLTWLC